MARFDFAAAAAPLLQHATAAKDMPMGQRAEAFAASLQRAHAYLESVRQSLPQGTVQFTLPGSEAPLTWTGWRVAEGQLTFTDTSKKPAKETVVAVSDFSLEQWESLLGKVAEPAEAQGGRATALAFAAVVSHQRASAAFLKNLRAADDQSGTGAAGYPLGVTAFDVLLGQLPADAPWAQGVRAEAQASRMLAAGLRALSERRNLAAANHVDRLLADHAHSFCVTGMP